jgi:hypothetical protein
MDAIPETLLAANGGRTEICHNTAKRSDTLFTLTPAQCAAEPERRYVIKHILSAFDHAAIIAAPGAGKSALAPYIGYRVALGLDVFGRRTRAGPVLYVAAEDGTGMKTRIRALYQRFGDAPNFHLMPAPIDFLSNDSTDVAQIERMIDRISPCLICIDTLARAFPGLKENDSDQMARVVRVSRGFASICGSAVISLHHPPKEGTTPRGHGLLNGDLDVTLMITGERADPRFVTMGKNRNGPADQTYCFTVATETLEVDDDGDPITAPIVEPEIVDSPGPTRPRLSQGERSAIRILSDLLLAEGKPLPVSNDYPAGICACSETRWREECLRRRQSTAEDKDSQKKAFRRAYGTLLQKKMVGALDGLVWLPKRAGEPSRWKSDTLQ